MAINEEEMLKKLNALKMRLSQKPAEYRFPIGMNGNMSMNDRDWWHTNYTHGQIEGNLKNCLEIIDDLIALLERK